MTGKKIRMNRIFQDDGKTLIVAMDHGGAMGPIPGIEDPSKTIQKVVKGGADAILVQFGILKQCHDELSKVGIIVNTQPNPIYVKEVLKMGGDAIKLTYFSPLKDRARLATIGPMAVECEKWDMPLLVELVPMQVDEARGIRKILYDIKSVQTAARISAEAGGDIVKTVYTGSVETFKEVTRCCPVPIVILGGEKMNSDRAILKVVRDSIDAGGCGICFGRNIWQHSDPTAITRALSKIIHEDASVEQSLKEL